jgi:hypothetical protein
VLFLGASGWLRGPHQQLKDWAITFSFAARPNVTGLTVGDITSNSANRVTPINPTTRGAGSP